MALSSATPPAKAITPVQMRRFYGIDRISFGPVVGDGRGQTIALIDAYDDPNASSDLQAFDAEYALPAPASFRQVGQDGSSNLPGTDPAGPSSRSWEAEQTLDVQWAHVIAPAANIVVVEATSDDLTSLFAAAHTAATLPGVSVVSMSFLTSEYPGETSIDSTFTTPGGHQGVTFVAATGDGGSPGGYPAYSPNVVAVGGTFIHLGPDDTYGNESGWSQSGGGLSDSTGGAPIEAEPAWQRPAQTSGARSTPDVSIDASPQSGVAIYDTFDFPASAPWAKFGGTSLATPMWAALLALADQGRATLGLPSLDGPTQTLPKLYSLPSGDFHDITSGSNGEFTAGAGYDEVTGLGSPVANKLVPDLAGMPPGPPIASVVGRFIFYHDSLFGDNDGSAGPGDDNAIATDKQPLLPGRGPATALNYTNYSKGINGIMVDIAGLPVNAAGGFALKLADFGFAVGNSDNPAAWSTAPTPTMLVRSLGAAGGLARIEFVWANGAIRNQWLQVSVKADSNTALLSPDVFYFGNLVGHTGDAVNGGFEVGQGDEAASQAHPLGFASPAPITDPYDYNRDGKVDAVDELIARYSEGKELVAINPGASTTAAPLTAPDLDQRARRILPIARRSPLHP